MKNFTLIKDRFNALPKRSKAFVCLGAIIVTLVILELLT